MSKPIKKKALELEEDESDSPAEESEFSFKSNVNQMELKARKELSSFLANKGIEESQIDGYRIHVKVRKPKRSELHKDPGFSVTYSCPNGSILMSKSDVLSSILDSKRKHQNNHLKSNGNASVVRLEAFDEASQILADTTFPTDIDGIKVISLGILNISPEFHCLTQLYPVGYRCEQEVSGTSMLNGPSTSWIVCEIGELDHCPEFRITVKASGESFIASTESSAWRKVDVKSPNYSRKVLTALLFNQFNAGNVETDSSPSFFNLDVERLIEGLEGALSCEGYKFHVERGYGSSYDSQVCGRIVATVLLHLLCCEGGIDCSQSSIAGKKRQRAAQPGQAEAASPVQGGAGPPR